MTSEERTRVFICIDFPDEIIKEITRVQECVSKTKFQGKITEPENLHLTLKFLGSVSEEQLSQIKTFLSKVKFNELELSLGEVGLFKHQGNPKIIWIKVNGEGIFSLQKQIDEALKPLFPKEERFMSHLTIARIKHVKDKPSFDNSMKSIHAKSLKFKISEFKLNKSDLHKLGPVYTTLKEFKAEKSKNL